MSRIRSFALLVAVVACGCVSSGIHERLSDLEKEEKRRQDTLRELNSQISASEERLGAAEAKAAYHVCLADRAEVESAIAVANAECLKEVAERSACLAKGEARTTRGGGIGCAAGWLAAVVTGGAAAPAIALGCASGVVLSETTKKSCGEVPPCARDPDPAATVLRSLGVSEVPTCVMPIREPASSRASSGTEPQASQMPCNTWHVEWVQFDVPPRKRSGKAWDADGSDPDLMYTIAVDGRRVYRSAKYQTLAWRHSPPGVSVSLGQTVSIELVDRDLASHDRIAEVQLELSERPTDTPTTVMAGRTKVQVQFACAEGG